MVSIHRGRRFVGWCFVCLAAAVPGATSPCAATEYLVADQVGNRIVAFDATTGEYLRTVWSTAANVQPASITFGPGGDLFVANRLAGDVLRIARSDLSGTNVAATTFASDIFRPGSIAYDAPTNSLLVGEFGEWPGGPLGDNIFVYDAAGAVTATLTLPEVAIGGLAFDPAGNLYASGFRTDVFASGRIYKFTGSPAWQPQGVFAPAPPDPSPLIQGAAGVAFDAAGDLYVAGMITANAGNIVKFKIESGQIVSEAQLGDFIPFPADLLMLDTGQLLVASLGFGPTSGSVYRFDSSSGARSVLLAGDFQRSGAEDKVVNGADLVVWQANFAATDAGDADADGDSDGADFLAWQRGVGRRGAPGLFSPAAFVVYDPPTAGAIPEPAAAALAKTTVVTIVFFRRRLGLRRSASRNRRGLV